MHRLSGERTRWNLSADLLTTNIRPEREFIRYLFRQHRRWRKGNCSGPVHPAAGLSKVLPGENFARHYRAATTPPDPLPKLLHAT